MSVETSVLSTEIFRKCQYCGERPGSIICKECKSAGQVEVLCYSCNRVVHESKPHNYEYATFNEMLLTDRDGLVEQESRLDETTLNQSEYDTRNESRAIYNYQEIGLQEMKMPKIQKINVDKRMERLSDSNNFDESFPIESGRFMKLDHSSQQKHSNQHYAPSQQNSSFKKKEPEIRGRRVLGQINQNVTADKNYETFGRPQFKGSGIPRQIADLDAEDTENFDQNTPIHEAYEFEEVYQKNGKPELNSYERDQLKNSQHSGAHYYESRASKHSQFEIDGVVSVAKLIQKDQYLANNSVSLKGVSAQSSIYTEPTYAQSQNDDLYINSTGEDNHIKKMSPSTNFSKQVQSSDSMSTKLSLANKNYQEQAKTPDRESIADSKSQAFKNPRYPESFEHFNPDGRYKQHIKSSAGGYEYQHSEIPEFKETGCSNKSDLSNQTQRSHLSKNDYVQASSHLSKYGSNTESESEDPSSCARRKRESVKIAGKPPIEKSFRSETDKFEKQHGSNHGIENQARYHSGSLQQQHDAKNQNFSKQHVPNSGIEQRQSGRKSFDYSPLPTHKNENYLVGEQLDRTNGTGYKLMEVGFEDDVFYAKRIAERDQNQTNLGQILKSEQIDESEKMRQSVQIQLDGLRDLHKNDLQNQETKHRLELERLNLHHQQERKNLEDKFFQLVSQFESLEVERNQLREKVSEINSNHIDSQAQRL